MVNPVAEKHPRKYGRVEDHAQAAVKIIAIEAGVSSFAWVQALCESRQDHQQDEQNYIREDVKHCGYARLFLIVGNA